MSSRNLNRFLKERGLLKAYRREQSIKRRIRGKIKLGGESVPIVTYKKGNKTIVAHAFDYRTIATSTKFNTKELPEQLSQGNVKAKFLGLRRFKNYDVERSQFIRNKTVGRVYLKIRFKKEVKGKRTLIETRESDNGFTVPLVSSNERARAEAKAFERCIVQLSFYEYTDFEILEREYWYNTSRVLSL